MTAADWRGGVRVVRAAALHSERASGRGRATAFEFAGTGGRSQTWIGTVTLPPNARTAAHHHATHEVAVYVSRGRSLIRWGEQLEYAAEVGPGDFVYFAPGVPHQESNPDSSEAVDFVVVRSDNSAIQVDLEIAPAAHPQDPPWPVLPASAAGS